MRARTSLITPALKLSKMLPRSTTVRGGDWSCLSAAVTVLHEQCSRREMARLESFSISAKLTLKTETAMNHALQHK